MEINIRIFFALFAVAFQHSNVYGYEMVKLYGSQNTVTSSTLAWIHARKGIPFSHNSVPIGSGGPLWCRAREHTIWISGVVVENKCRIPFLGNIYHKDDFDYLVSLNGSARLVNVPWDNFQSFPSNAVSTPGMLLALSPDSEGAAVLPGFVDIKERRATFLRGNESIKSTEGTIVTEKEPAKYRLEDVRLGEDSTPLVHEEVLQELVLRNSGEFDREISQEVTFISPHVVYFARMKGTVVALPTSVSGPETFPVDIKWGINNNLNHNRTVEVSRRLPARSSVRVRLTAVIRNLDAMYYGRLVSVYDDGVELERMISGLHTERKLAELRADFDEAKSLFRDDDIGLTPPQSVILLHSTTTTPAPIFEANNQPSLSGSSSSSHLLPKPQEVGVNGAMRLASLWGISVLLIMLP